MRLLLLILAFAVGGCSTLSPYGPEPSVATRAAQADDAYAQTLLLKEPAELSPDEVGWLRLYTERQRAANEAQGVQALGAAVGLAAFAAALSVAGFVLILSNGTE